MCSSDLVREQAYKDYEARLGWARKMLVNISKAGFFSSDRTIAEYNRDIWKLNPEKTEEVTSTEAAPLN